MASVECAWPLKADLGEGPFWSAAEKALWFVDIFEKQIHRFAPDTGRHQSWTAPAKVSFVLPETRGSFLVGLSGAVARFHSHTGSFEILARVETDYPQNRLNDACIDWRGRLWFGSMDEDGQRKSAAIYRWGAEPAPLLADSGYCISNGPAFSPDGKTFYATDTLEHVLYRFAVGEDGALADKTPLICFSPEDGFPDGTSVDAEGCLWVAFWDGWCVRRFSPAGKKIAEVKLPCARVTKLAFGGDGLKTAYVTTARHGLEPQDLAGQPLAGGIFAFEVDVPGLPQPLAKSVGTAAQGCERQKSQKRQLE